MPSYEQRQPSKLWSVRFRIITEEGEKNKRLSGFRTKKEAQKAYEEFITSYEYHAPVKSDGLFLFGELIDEYLNHAKTQIKESSFYDAQSKINRHIRPYFGEKRIDAITAAMILEWQRTLSSYSYQYRTNLRGYLTAIYRYGERYHNIENVMRKVEPIRNLEPKKEMQFWTLDEFQKFISVVDNPVYHTFFRFLYISGCRKGEALALTFRDIHSQSNTITINKSVTRKVKGESFKITTPKNFASNRTIEIPVSLIKDMLALKTNCDDDFVFGGTRPLADRTTDRAFVSYCSKAGVKKIRLHDFRHSCASLLISQGVSIVAVSKRLGHTNIEQTLNTYSHMMPSDSDKINTILNNI